MTAELIFTTAFKRDPDYLKGIRLGEQFLEDPNKVPEISPERKENIRRFFALNATDCLLGYFNLPACLEDVQSIERDPLEFIKGIADTQEEIDIKAMGLKYTPPQLTEILVDYTMGVLRDLNRKTVNNEPIEGIELSIRLKLAKTDQFHDEEKKISAQKVAGTIRRHFLGS